MAKYLVLQDFISGGATIAAASIVNDAQENLTALRAAGLCAMPYVPATHDTIIARYKKQRARLGPAVGSLAAMLIAAGATAVAKPSRFVAMLNAEGYAEFATDMEGTDTSDQYIARFWPMITTGDSFTVDPRVSGAAADRTWEVLANGALRCRVAGPWSVSFMMTVSPPTHGTEIYICGSKNGEGIGMRNGVDFDPPQSSVVTRRDNATLFYEGDFVVGDTVQLLAANQNANAYEAQVECLQLRVMPA